MGQFGTQESREGKRAGGRRRELPPAEIIVKMLESGWTRAEVANEFGVTPAAVTHSLDRHGVEKPRVVTYRDIFPYRVETRHRNAQVMHRLRTLAKIESGIPVTEIEQERLEAWLANMREADVVLTYHPEAPPNDASSVGGFYYDKRNPGERGVIRH